MLQNKQVTKIDIEFCKFGESDVKLINIKYNWIICQSYSCKFYWYPLFVNMVCMVKTKIAELLVNFDKIIKTLANILTQTIAA